MCISYGEMHIFSIFVILSGAKNLGNISICIQILRIAQDDRTCFSLKILGLYGKKSYFCP